MSETQLQRRSEQVTVRSLVESPAYSNRLKTLLGDRAPQFVTSLIQISQDWKLAKCEPNSIIAAGMTAAALDLPINPNLGFAYIVPYGDRASFQIGYKGFVQLATRSGQYKRLNVTEVFEGELLKYDRVRGECVVEESKRKPGGKVIGYVAYFELVSGYEHAEYWSVETVTAHALRFSQAYKAKKLDSPWFTNFDSMGKKTVLKALLSHWGPLSVQMQDAVSMDGGFQAAPDAPVEFPDNAGPVSEEAPNMPTPQPEEAPKRRGRKPAEPAPAQEPTPPTNPLPAESQASPVPTPNATETPQQVLVRRIFDESKVTFDDFTDFLANQGIDRTAKDWPDVHAVPAKVWEYLWESVPVVTKLIRTYGVRTQQV